MPKPWLTEDEQAELRADIERNDALDIVGTGDPNDPPKVRYGLQWYAMLVFQRASTGVSFRDTTHGIMEPIPILQSLPYRLSNYRGVQSIPFAIPMFPKNPGAIPIYMEKSDHSIGDYADLYFLSSDGKLRNPQGGISSDGSVTVYVEHHAGGNMDAFFSGLQTKVMRNAMRGQDRALSGKEAFPFGLGR